MSDTPASEAPDGSPAEGPGPVPEPAPEGVNRLARDGLDLFLEGMSKDMGQGTEDAEETWACEMKEEIDRLIREAAERDKEQRREKEALDRYRERLTSGLDEHQAASELDALPDKKSPKARRLSMLRDAAARNARTVKWAAPTAVAIAIAVVFIGVFAGRDTDDPAATFDSVVASVTSETTTTLAPLPSTTSSAPPVTTSVSSTTATSQATPTTPPSPPSTVPATAPAGEDPVAGLWDFSAVAGAPGTGGHIANFTLVDGKVETDTGYTGTYEVIREGDVTRVEITLTGELGGRVSHAWFHMRLENGELRGTGEADALGSANESSTSTTRTTVKFQNEIVGTRIAG